MSRFQKKEYTMYGFDALSIALLLLSLILNAVTFLLPHRGVDFVGLFGFVPVILVILRVISGNHENRQRENQIFLGLLAPFTNGMDERTEEREQKKIFRFFKCPACQQKIRVPKGKGRVEITCPKCTTRFIKKT